MFVSLNVYFLIKGLHKVMKKDRQSTNAVEGQHSRMDVLEAMWRTVKGPKLTWMVWVGWKFVCCAHTVERSEMIIIMKRSCKLLNSRDTQMFSVQLVILVEQELLTHPEHLSSLPVFSGVRVTRYLVLYVCFADRCLSFCTFSFGHRCYSNHL